MRPQRLLRLRPRYADVAATLALLLASSGTAYAVTALPKHSVGAKQLKTGAVKERTVGTHAISGSKIKTGAVSTSALATRSVTNAKIAANAVNGSNLADGSVSLADITGTDVTGAISLPSLTGGNCTPQSLIIAGAEVGQVALFSFTGSTAAPATLVTGPTRVIAPGTVALTFCNVGSSPISFSNLGVRVITFG